MNEVALAFQNLELKYYSFLLNDNSMVGFDNSRVFRSFPTCPWKSTSFRTLVIWIFNQSKGIAEYSSPTNSYRDRFCHQFVKRAHKIMFGQAFLQTITSCQRTAVLKDASSALMHPRTALLNARTPYNLCYAHCSRACPAIQLNLPQN